MNFTRNKFVRFKDWSSPSNQPAKELGSWKKILDPRKPFLLKWNKIFVLSCMIAVSLDPLFFYIPVLDGVKKCLDVDKKVAIISCILRSFTDIFYILHIIFQFRTGFIAPSSRVFGRGELIEDQSAIVIRYLSSYFIVDILSVLPLPQVALLVITTGLKGPVSLVTKDSLKFIVLSQYVPRLFRIYPLYKEVTRTYGIFTGMAWAGAAFNFLLYMLASHVVGAFWYLLSIERKVGCWQDACWELKCDSKYLLCGEHHTGDNAFLNASCPLYELDGIKNSRVFNFGIFLDALQSGVLESGDFPRKLYYCFWWGLQNLSSLGQNLKASSFAGEISFAVFISISGLVLFSLLIINMQKYLQSTTVSVDSRIEEIQMKRRDVERWMSRRMLPECLRERIRLYEQHKQQETRGVEEETLLCNFPRDLRRDIKRHLCLGLLMRVPMFEKMNEQLMDEMCDRLKSVLYIERSFITREGDPVDEMLFIMQGNLVTMTTYGGKTGFFNSAYLNAGDFCGEDILLWALDPNSSSNLPSSTRTVQALTEVEAFALMANDLKLIASQFRRLHSRVLQHTFRFYSLQWRTWATCFIQTAWRQYCKRKSLRVGEDRLHDALNLAKEAGTSSSLGATIYASKFASNVLRTLRHNGLRNARLPQRLPLLLPQKPAEPDFTVENH